ncbi:MAG: hypothetical protein IAG13_27420 [Deltaproteobacteria bacterium]|nr:hypothetical protein [Nannocystaceae bacterium]
MKVAALTPRTIGAALLLACTTRVPLAAELTTTDASTSGTDISTSGPETTSSTGDEHSLDIPGDVAHEDPVATALDVLFVVDNSAGMAEAQLHLAWAMGGFVDEAVAGGPRSVQVMFTNTENGNPSCGSDIANTGTPIATGCNERIARFTSNGFGEPPRPDACTLPCPYDLEPVDPFVAFDSQAGTSNVPGDFDTPIELAKRSLACLLPQGINGCGYEAPLEAMAQALNPGAAWNIGARPFLRDGADLAIVIVSNESDCSIEDFSMMQDPQYMNSRPGHDHVEPSSAMCWNAGVSCIGPDRAGVYSECAPMEGPMHPTWRYVEMLEYQREQGKRVTMLALTGVPEVDGRAVDSPWQPISGGLSELVYRDWLPSDIGPSDTEYGKNAPELQFDFGIGPACDGNLEGLVGTRALPSPRLIEVCMLLDDGDRLGCCVESICYAPDDALRCLLGVSAG